jgi:NAD(P)-dependent dehydrogenase (short-subunit alcohol dehydrogenase family)
MEFQDKAILITGSSRGIGLATAKAFLERGARVAINGRTEASVNQAIAALGNDERLLPIAGSVESVAGCESIVERAVEGLDGLDVLVNSAGVYPIAAIADCDEGLWDETLDINLKGTFFCSRAAMPALRASQGSIVNLASTAGLVGFSNTTVYCASKGAIVNLTRAMALELAPNVRVNCVCPTAADTEMGRKNFASTDDARQRFEALIPMGRLLTPEEVAAAIVYLASHAARTITGTALTIDGGRTAGG